MLTKGIKTEIRNSMLAKRRQMSNALELSQQISQIILADPIWQQAQAIGLYLSINNEVNTQLLIKAALNSGKKVFLPRCLPGDYLDFLLYTNNTILLKNKFSILEPDPQGAILKEPTLDLVFMPALALTPQGGRLGYGKGYYDRTLSRSGWIDIPRLGLIYSWQLTEFKTTELDLDCQGYVTERGVFWL